VLTATVPLSQQIPHVRAPPVVVLDHELADQLDNLPECLHRSVALVLAQRTGEKFVQRHGSRLVLVRQLDHARRVRY